MRKINFRGVFEGFRSTQGASTKPEIDFKETLASRDFEFGNVVRYGFPYDPTCMAYDPVQKLLAIGNKIGAIRIFARPGVDFYLQHTSQTAVKQLIFLINEGALISVCEDDCLHLWNFRQKRPEIVNSLQFQKEKITCCHLPLQSKWLYVGTDRGNIHVVSVEDFVVSGYVINWNKAIGVQQKSRPGSVVHLSDCPADESKLLIGYEIGMLVIWDLKNRVGEPRGCCDEGLTSISWHFEGKQFVCSHTNGTLSTWSTKSLAKPSLVSHPHARKPAPAADGSGPRPVRYRPITKVEWRVGNEDWLIFSGGLPAEEASHSVSVLRGKSTTVLEMEHPVLNFIALCDSPHLSEAHDPFAVAVLLQNDLVIVDLSTPGYPCFENPYPMDIHESPVTCCAYISDVASDLISALYSVGSKQKRQGFSDQKWPIVGGTEGEGGCAYQEIVITGHADGSIKFWDASGLTLPVLYKLKTWKPFERSNGSLDKPAGDASKQASFNHDDEEHFSVQRIEFCVESRLLAVAGNSAQVIVYRFSKIDSTDIVTVLQVPIESHYSKEEGSSSTKDAGGADGAASFDSNGEKKPLQRQPSVQSGSSATSEGSQKDCFYPVKVKGGPQKKPAGYQPELVCLVPWLNKDLPEQIGCLVINSAYGLLSFGTENGLAVVDIVQHVCVFTMSISDLYCSFDVYTRLNKSSGHSLEKNPSSESEVVNSPTLPFENHSADYGMDSLGGKMKATAKGRGPERVKSQEKDGTRSRSSSVCSDEVPPSSESVTCIQFMDSTLGRPETPPAPSMFIGTSNGTLIGLCIYIATSETRSVEPVAFAPSAVALRGKHSILCLAFLDPVGELLLPPVDQWRDPNKGKDKDKDKATGGSGAKVKSKQSPPQTQDAAEDPAYFVMVTEREITIHNLCSPQTVHFRHEMDGRTVLVGAKCVLMEHSPVLMAASSTGKVYAISLPSLRVLMQTSIQLLPLQDLRIAKTICFTHHGHGLYLCSPGEIQKFSVSKSFLKNPLPDLIGDLFSPKEMPQPPKPSLMKSFLFSSSSQSVDREELFGPASGKASKSVARQIPGRTADLQKMAQSNEIAKTRLLMAERGEKLSKVEDATARLDEDSRMYASNARSLMEKYREKNEKWYNPFS